MALVTADRVRETTTTTGTGALTLAGAVTGFRAFSSVMANNDTCYYVIAHQTIGEWECGSGTYNSSANTLTRSTVHSSSNSNSAVNFSAGTKDVFLSVTKTSLQNLSVNASYINVGTLSTSYGGTGLTGPNGFLYGNGSGPAMSTFATIPGSLVIGEITATLKETPFTITDGASVTINPANGGIQLWTLGANRTPASGFSAGQSVTLMIDDGAAYSITWTTINPTWIGGNAPTLATTGYTVIEMWRAGSIVYGALVGYA
jgi:hypothetical protein